MPYNNTAIPPSDEVTGQVSLPCMILQLLGPDIKLTLESVVARVKKILQADDEIAPVSQNAAFVITLATVYRSTRFFKDTALTSVGNVHPVLLRTSPQPGEDRHQA